MIVSTLSLDATIFTRAQLEARLRLPEAARTAQIALAGRSNVGKSSLINALARRRNLAKTSSTPGKTRSINYYAVAPEGFWLVDLPGYGYARSSRAEQQKWSDLAERYVASCPRLRALVLLLDCRLPPQASDQHLAGFARERNIPILPVLTKADQCRQREQAERQKEWAILLDGRMPRVVSARQGTGLDALWAALREQAATCSPRL
jgi:GTP-binding protein